ncbi:MAG TPA: hypothetical protein ENI05_02515, partial [Porticoccus sp.]|nr:hypothetical protein [Porticoccus sp.]
INAIPNFRLIFLKAHFPKGPLMAFLAEGQDAKELVNKVCELNVTEQVVNVCKTNIIKDAWARGQELTVHGWIYSIADGLLKDLGVNISNLEEMRPKYHVAVQDINKRYT